MNARFFGGQLIEEALCTQFEIKCDAKSSTFTASDRYTVTVLIYTIAFEYDQVIWRINIGIGVL